MPPKYEQAALPSDIHAEKVILASILADNEIFFEGAADLIATDFSLDSHQKIFATINSILFGLADDVSTADVITVASELKKKKQLSTVGGYGYLLDLGGDFLNQTKRLSSHVAIVKDKARLRRLMMVFSNGQARASEQSEPAEEIVADVQNRLLEDAAEGSGRAVRIGDITSDVEARIEEKRHIDTDKAALGMTWGVQKIDDFSRGLHDGEVTVLAAESGGGKTAAALQAAIANAKEETPVGIFSMEMGKVKLSQRAYPQISEMITASMMRDPRLINLHTHIPEVKRVSEELARLPIYIDDTVGLDISTLVARIRMMRRREGCRLFVLDYLQLIVNRSKREMDTMPDTMFRLRDLVKVEPTIHILLLSQYSKSDGFTKKKRRTRGDLYGGSVIHQAAQNVVLLTIEDEEGKDPKSLLDVEFRFDKQRDGRKGKVVTCFDRDHLTYRDPIPVIF